MAYPAQVTPEKIIAQAIKLIERDGELSLHELARELGIKAPSLYRYFASRERLVAKVSLAGFRKLAAFIRTATADAPSLHAAVWAMRRFARKHPALYRVMNESDAQHEDRDEALAATLDILAASFGGPVPIEALASIQPAFLAVRAYAHGYIVLELSGQYRGNLDDDFEAGLQVLLAGFQKQISQQERAPRSRPVSAARSRK